MAHPRSTTALAGAATGFDRVLHIAGRHAWTHDSIAAYKAAQLAAYPASALWPYRNLLKQLERVFKHSAIWTSLACCILAVLTVVSAFIATDRIAIFGLGCLLCLCWSLLVNKVETSIVFRLYGPPAWSLHTLEYVSRRHRQPPAEVQEIISRTHQLCPAVTCTVDVLERDSVILDPILYLNDVPVIVWDEDGKIVPPPV